MERKVFSVSSLYSDLRDATYLGFRFWIKDLLNGECAPCLTKVEQIVHLENPSQFNGGHRSFLKCWKVQDSLWKPLLTS